MINNGILTLCIGGCGIYSGAQFISTVSKEHKLDIDGDFIGDRVNEHRLLSKLGLRYLRDIEFVSP